MNSENDRERGREDACTSERARERARAATRPDSRPVISRAPRWRDGAMGSDLRVSRAAQPSAAATLLLSWQTLLKVPQCHPVLRLLPWYQSTHVPGVSAASQRPLFRGGGSDGAAGAWSSSQLMAPSLCGYHLRCGCRRCCRRRAQHVADNPCTNKVRELPSKGWGTKWWCVSTVKTSQLCHPLLVFVVSLVWVWFVYLFYLFCWETLVSKYLDFVLGVFVPPVIYSSLTPPLFLSLSLSLCLLVCVFT